MDDDQYAYSDLKGAVRIKDEDGVAEFGFVVDGAFFAVGGAKLAGFYEDVKEAQQAKAEQKQQAAAEEQAAAERQAAQEQHVAPDAQPQ